MAEVLVQFDTDIRDADGVAYTPSVCARHRDDGLWEAWIEFAPADPARGAPLRSGRETEQAERDDVVYWAGGLTSVYLEGALARARAAAHLDRTPRLGQREVDAAPRFDGPAPG
jgi:hypothetical protein